MKRKNQKSTDIRVDGQAAIRNLGWVPREGQAEATAELIKALYSGAKIIAFTAPTGSGKSGMTLGALKWVEAKAVIATPTKQLQMQYRDTFALQVLFGRAEYDCPLSPTGNAALAPCIAGQPCLFKAAKKCQYLNAREAVQGRRYVVVNHSLLLISRLMQDSLLSHQVIVIDECHRFLDAAKMTLVPSGDTADQLERFDWDPAAIKARLKEAFISNNVALATTLVNALRLATCRRIAPGLFDGALTNERLFRSGLFGRVILVSATLPVDIQPDVLIEGPSLVPPEMRPLIVIPVAAVNVDNQSGVAQVLAAAAQQIIANLDSSGPVIIHTGTTVLADAITSILLQTELADRIVPAWGSSRKAVTRVRRNPDRQIVIGPALTDGVDLPTARLQIIAKVPFPQIQNGGVRQAAIQLTQAYGRLVRGPQTSGTTVVLDANFRLIEPLLPPYVREAVRWERLKA